MAERRGNGEGSVYRHKDGLWVGQYKIQIPTGTKTKYIYSKSRKDVATKLARPLPIETRVRVRLTSWLH